VYRTKRVATQRRSPPSLPPPPYNMSWLPSAAAAAMDPEVRRRACVAFRAKLSRDTGVTLTASDCEYMLATTFNGGGQVNLQRDPGLFYVCLGEAIENQLLPLVIPEHMKVAWWCVREAAEVHNNRDGMRKLALCYHTGQGVTEDPAPAAVWIKKAADLGDAASKAMFGKFLVCGDARAGVAKDAARGFKLLREAVEQGHGLPVALYIVAGCYLQGEGVEKDAAHGVSLLRQVITQGGPMTAKAQTDLAVCYRIGHGVEADTVKAALWCQSAATGGYAEAIEMLAVIRTCDFCSSRCGGIGVK
jgi:TPR repeat protein